jgi:hypothetical protein
MDELQKQLKQLSDAIVRLNKKLDNLIIAPTTTGCGGTTALRPITPYVYEQYFDTTLGIPIWYDGSNWVDATGTLV